MTTPLITRLEEAAEGSRELDRAWLHGHYDEARFRYVANAILDLIRKD